MNKLFGTDGIRGKANVFPLTPEMITRIGRAIALYFEKKSIKSKKNKALVIGKDTRLSGYMIETALSSGIVSAGFNVFFVGPMPTPAISHLVKSLNCIGGIVVSASHNPAEDNGIKVFNEEGFKLSEEEEKKIEELVFNENSFTINKIGKAYRIDDCRGRYIEFLKSTINNKSLAGLTIALDCANGAAYSLAPRVFSELGAKVIAFNVKPNGLNINKNCGALHPEFLAKKIKKLKADIGFAFDGDSDRLIAIDEKGNILNGDKILAITALYFAKKRMLRKKAIVATVMANQALIELMKKNKIKVFITKVGDKFVIEELRKRNLSLGGEQSGHIIFFDYSVSGDAIIAALQLAKIVVEERKKLSVLSSILKPFPQLLINVKVKEKKPFNESILNEIKKAEKKLKGKGRLLVRYSGTENIARVMVEGKNKKQIKIIAERIAEKIKEADANE
jgi:phosphoglucosamine mutase